MAWGTQPKQDELARWELRIADLERRIADQKRRVSSELGEGLGAREVLHFMEQTLENWREHGRVLRQRQLPPFLCVNENPLPNC